MTDSRVSREALEVLARPAPSRLNSRFAVEALTTTASLAPPTTPTYDSEVLADSPLVYLRLEETSGTVAADSSGNGRSGTYVNNPSRGVTGLLASDPSSRAVQLDGTDDYVNIAYGSWMDLTDAITVEFVCKMTTPASGTRVLANRHNGGLDHFRIYLSSTGQVMVLFRTSSADVFSTGYVMTEGVTYHCALTYNRVSIILYINGVAVWSTPKTAAMGLVTSAFTRFGAYSGGTYNYPGVMDEIAVYSTALSASRIAAHHAAMAAGATIVPGGTAEETDTALAGAAVTPQAILGGVAFEADEALGGAVAQRVYGGLAGEADEGLPGTHWLKVPGGTAAEADEALAGTLGGAAPVVYAGSYASETDEALPGQAWLVYPGGLALEVETALAGVVLTPGAEPTASIWTGAGYEDANLLGVWDGSVVQPAVLRGWWNGSSIQTLRRATD